MPSFEEGQALFEQGKYAEAKEIFTAALEGPNADAKKLKMWVRKCDAHLSEKSEAGPTATPPAVVTTTESAAPPVSEKPPTAAGPSAPPRAASKPVSLIRHEWFQSPTTLTFNFFVKNRKSDDVSVQAEAKSFEITIKLDEGKEFQVSFDPLFGEIDPMSVKVDVRPVKVEVVINKAATMQWPTLEGTASAAVITPAAASAAPTQNELPSAYSRNKKFVVNDEDIKDVDGGDPTTNFFKQIFGNGTEEQRRAMMKSFQQSGGTVLSTNWEDIGARDVKCEAPKGMEARKWEV